MTYAKFVNNLNKMTNCRAYYRQVPAGTQLPFVCWRVQGTTNIGADNIVHKQIPTILVELYTSEKDFNREREIEKIFSDAMLFWDKDEIALNDEAVTLVTYTIEMPVEFD